MHAHLRPGAGHLRSAVAAALLAILVAAAAGCGGSAISAKEAAQARAALEPGQAAGGPGDSQDPGDPAAPGDPSDPGDPSVPGDPSDPGNPSNPGNPSDPGNPSNPGNPGNPGNPKPGGTKVGSCAGFKNQKGITDTEIRIGNSSDISGPVPGLFTQSQQATRAYVEYFNSSGVTICGRKLKLDLYDSRTDAGGDQQGYLKGCDNDFAMVGSMSSFDSGGAKVAEDCGIPDIRGIATTVERGRCKTCFGAQPAGPDAFQNAIPDFIKRNASGGQKAAMLYINIGAAASNGQSQAKHMQARGVKFALIKGIDVAEFNYGPYVQTMKQAGVTSVQFIAAPPQFARMAQAMESANFKPKVYLLDPSGYDPDYPDQAGGSAKGTVVFLNFPPFEEASKHPEEALYMKWLQQVAPGAQPGFFGLFSWSSAKLFVEQALKLGGNLNRASLIAAMRKVDNWTAGGLHAPQNVGSKEIASCWRFIQWSGSAWKPIEGTAYQCRGITKG